MVRHKDWAYWEKSRRKRPIDIRLDGFAGLTGRKDDRFRCSGETRDVDTFRQRESMVRDLHGRLMFEPLAAVLDERITLTQLHQAYRAGNKALAALVEKTRAPELRPLIAEYLQEKKRNKSLRHTKAVLEHFATWAESDGVSTTAALTQGRIAKYLTTLTRRQPAQGKRRGAKALSEEPVSAATSNRYRAILSGLCSWLMRRKQLHEHPIAFRQVERLSEGQPRMPRFLAADYTKYVEAVENFDDEARTLAVLLLIHTGADVDEVLTRRVNDLLDGAKDGLARMHYKRTKTNTPERLVPVEARLATRLRGYIAARGLERTDLLFPDVTYHKVRVAHRHGRTAIRQPHLRIKDLRHVAAQFWRKGGADLQMVREWLGHSSIDQTTVYNQFGPDDEFERPVVSKAFDLLTADQDVLRLPSHGSPPDGAP